MLDSTRWIIRNLAASAAFFVLFFALSPSTIKAAQLEVPSQYPSIQAAIDSAQAGDVINVAPGTYNEAINFLGKEITVQGAGQGVSILDGAGLNTSVVSAVSGETTSTIFEGFTVTGGTGTSFGWASWGGGLYVEYSSITVQLHDIIKFAL